MLAAKPSTFSQLSANSYVSRIQRVAQALILSVLVSLGGQRLLAVDAQAGWQWYKTDTHIHSSVSADAYPDLGILSDAAKAAGFNAIFVTDHNLASEFPANGVANQVPFEDSYLHLFTGTYGVLSSSTNSLVGSPVNTGTKSLHLASTSASSGETSVWAVRGPNFRSGDIILKVSIYPTRIDPGSGAYVSVSIGGDPRLTTSPVGYTTQAGVISPGKSTVLVWQLGSARAASTNPNARVLVYSLGSYTLNTWNHYTINVSNYLADIPAADRPLEYNALTHLKMAAAANGGTADVYFDTYSVAASAPLTPAEEFVYRSSIIHNFDTSDFKAFPSLEMGNTNHANRFDFGITNPSQFDFYPAGVDGILPTQQAGYPAQLNHPGSSGGVTAQEAIDNQAYGADFMEVARHQEWIDIWDAILNQGVQLLGSGSTDKHTASYSASSDATFIYAPALDFDSLIRSYFEGRTFMGGNFSGPAVFNLDGGSREPYPARYPVYVSDTQSTADVHLAIPDGVRSGYTVRWIRNGLVVSTDTVTGSSYDGVKSISLAGATTYVRAEVLSSSGAIRALTQPIFFRDVTGLPADKSYHIDGVGTVGGRGYTRIITKGVTASTWNNTNKTLSLALENAADSLVGLRMSTNNGPQRILVDNSPVSAAASLVAFEAATGSSWYYDSAATALHLKVKHTGSTANLMADFSAAPAANVCRTSGPASAAYAVTVCFTGPSNGATISGVRTVSATASVSGADPGVARLVFYLGGEYLLTDFQAPFDYQLPTTKWVDGTRLLEVEAQMKDGFISQRASISLNFKNNITQPPVNNNTYTPKSGTTPPSGQAFTLAVTGDGAGGMVTAGAVADLIGSWNPNLVLYLGDVYEEGTPTEFYNWYGTSSTFFGRFRSITNPVVGNHEYLSSPGALGYFDYWDNVPNFYSFDAAGWHVIALNSNCSKAGGCNVGSPQYQWLASDLAAHSNVCTIAYYHHPVYFVGPVDDPQNMGAIWSLLAQNGVDLVLNGHDHSYQRWKPLDGNGTLSPNGINEFIVGGGGHGIQQFTRQDSRLAAGVDSADSFGALRLQLNPQGAGYQYVNTAGVVMDSGSVLCSGAAPDTVPPTKPTNLTAVSRDSNTVTLSWTGATDNVGVTAYDIYRDGSLLTSVPAMTQYDDLTVVPNTTYTYQIRARDAVGQVSGLSNSAMVVTLGLLFGDGFESGNLSQWTTVSGLTVQQQEVHSGAYAARATSTGTATYAYKQLSQTQTDLYYRLWFKNISQGNNSVYLQRFRTSSTSAMLGVFISSTGKLGYRNDVTGVTTISNTTISPGTWHELQVHVQINGAAGATEVWLDNIRVSELSQTQDLGTTPVGLVQLGENASGRTYDVALDQIALSTVFIGSSTTPTVTPTATNPGGPTATPTPTRTATATPSPTPTATTPPVVAGPGIYDDANAAWSYSGSWTAYTGGGPYANTMHYTNAQGASASLTFSGTGFKVWFTKYPNRGDVEVWIDGVLKYTFSENGSVLAWQQTWTLPTALSNGTHTVQLKNPNASTATYIDIDAIEITGPVVPVGLGTYDDANAAWSYSGSWIAYSGAGPYANTMHYTNSQGASASITFTGRQFKVWFTKYPNRGNVEVWIDGALNTTFSENGPSLAWQQTWTLPTVLSTGTHTVQFKNPNASTATYIDIDAITIFEPDVTPPGTITNLAASTGANVGEVNLSWTAVGDDGNTGTAASYLVRYSSSPITTETAWNNATPFANSLTPKAAGGSESLAVTGLFSAAPYYFAVRAQDEQPNLGGLSNSPSATAKQPTPVGPGIYDDANAAWSYTGSWTAYTGGGPYANTMHYTNAQGASASLTFSGTGFKLWFTKYPNRGNVEVWIDGVLNTTISEYGSALAWQQTWTLPTVLSNGTHTVQLKNPNASTATYIDIDAIEITGPVVPVGPGTYDDANAAWSYSGSWIAYSGAGPYANTMHYTNSQGASASLTFTGTGFTVYFTNYPNRGDVEVWIDGVLRNTFSEYASALAWQQTWTLPAALSAGTHTVQFKNPNASTATYIDIDAIQIK